MDFVSGKDREMSKDQKKTPAGRRDFLKLACLGAVAGAAAATAGAPKAEAKTAERPDGKGYRETAHVKKFYETARF